jgi:hypothetical protein
MKRSEFSRLGTWIASSVPGLMSKKDLVFYSPINHTLRAISFDESINQREFYVQVFVQPLFVPSDVIFFNLGWRLGGNARVWNTDAPQARDEIIEEIRGSAVPFLEAAESIDGLIGTLRKLDKAGDPIVRQALGYAYALKGDADRCSRELAKLTAGLDTSIPWVQRMSEQAKGLVELVRQDSVLAKAQLCRWEEETAKTLGLSDYLR